MIDLEAEQRAAATIFFSEREFEGTVRRLCDVNYLPMLNLFTEDVSSAVFDLRKLLQPHTPERVEADLSLLFKAVNWRFHLVACASMLIGHCSQPVVDAAWQRLRGGSWVSPQIAATGALVDAQFLREAEIAARDSATSPKAFVAIHALCEGALHLARQDQERLIAEQAKDPDHAGEIAIRWRDDARRVFA